ncbi:hypothetical protein T440DRAFT_26987 [Plenodomus tracheiphilus IPT5]|uniref:Uncharacterized protein n=1 Tax=Plenodomus tracheiphilus IPT5 TaxID=1408161 RepID=A0A6A7AMD2_9PLEO|nr:hypothetical protein T440DRAFT_26987 [Plenodomus tracheiphilus IPT5]
MTQNFSSAGHVSTSRGICSWIDNLTPIYVSYRPLCAHKHVLQGKSITVGSVMKKPAMEPSVSRSSEQTRCIPVVGAPEVAESPTRSQRSCESDTRKEFVAVEIGETMVTGYVGALCFAIAPFEQ